MFSHLKYEYFKFTKTEKILQVIFVPIMYATFCFVISLGIMALCDDECKKNELEKHKGQKEINERRKE